MDAAKGGVLEVQLGKLAEEKASKSKQTALLAGG
jgi:hypothetical protein